MTDQEKLRPFLGQTVKLFIKARTFKLSLEGTLKEHKGASQADIWISIDHEKPVMFFEIDWNYCRVKDIYTQGEPTPRIFIEEIVNG